MVHVVMSLAYQSHEHNQMNSADIRNRMNSHYLSGPQSGTVKNFLSSERLTFFVQHSIFISLQIIRNIQGVQIHKKIMMYYEHAMFGTVTRKICTPKFVPSGPNILKYLFPLELIFQKIAEIHGPPPLK